MKKRDIDVSRITFKERLYETFHPYKLASDIKKLKVLFGMTIT